jgi:hypothetical protein
MPYSRDLAGRRLKILLRTPAAARDYGGAARPGVFTFGPVPEETVMSITAWIVPGQAADCATAGRQSGWANQ